LGAERLVAAPLILGVRRDQVIIGEAQGDTRADLGEPARHQPVVDLDTRDVIDEVTRCHHPADTPGDHALVQRRRAHIESPRPVADLERDKPRHRPTSRTRLSMPA